MFVSLLEALDELQVQSLGASRQQRKYRRLVSQGIKA
jgi:hypothetical protein